MAFHQSTEFGCADAVMLTEITEVCLCSRSSDLAQSSFVENLSLRFKKNKIYTYIGEVVVSINPYTDLGIYTDAVLHEYHGKSLYQVLPADKARVSHFRSASLTSLRWLSLCT